MRRIILESLTATIASAILSLSIQARSYIPPDDQYALSTEHLDSVPRTAWSPARERYTLTTTPIADRQSARGFGPRKRLRP